VEAPLNWISTLLDKIKIPEPSSNSFIAAHLQNVLYSILEKAQNFKKGQFYMYERLFLKSIVPTFQLFSDYFSSLEFSDPNHEFFLTQDLSEDSVLPAYVLKLKKKLLKAQSARCMILATV
jgi:hypothetical protein